MRFIFDVIAIAFLFVGFLFAFAFGRPLLEEAQDNYWCNRHHVECMLSAPDVLTRTRSYQTPTESIEDMIETFEGVLNVYP